MIVTKLAKRHVLHLVHEWIVRFWVHPLESRIVPRLSEEKPSRLRFLLLGLASWCANAGRVAVLDMRVTVTRMVGQGWSAVYIGAGTSVEAIGHILFPEPPEVHELPRAFLWQVPALARRFAGAGDLVVGEFNEIIHLPPIDGAISFATRDWVKQILDEADRPIDEILAAMNQTMRRHVRQLATKGFSYVFTQAQEDFDLFYYRMHRPYITSRHNGRGAVWRGYEEMLTSFRQGGLILVKQGPDAVCGMLCDLAGDMCRAFEMGVLDGDFDRVRQGANVALWWFMLDWARQQGARRFDFGGSRAQTANGTFRFKRQWGTRVHPDRNSHVCWNLLGQGLPAQLREHLNTQGLITEVDGACYRVLLLGPAETLSQVGLARQLSEAASCGLAGLAVHSAEGRMHVVLCQDHEPASGNMPGWLVLQGDSVSSGE